MNKELLASYQPDYYKNSKVMQQINNANANELTLFDEHIEQVRNNYFFDTLDSNMCSRWEKILKIHTNISDDINYRRTRIISYFAGMGNFSATLIKNIVKYYSNSEVNPIFDVPKFKILIKIISSYNSGLPYSLKYFEEIINDLKPAFFQIDYELISLTKDQLNINTYLLSGEEIQVFPYQIKSVESKGKVKFALGNTQNAEIVSVNPR